MLDHVVGYSEENSRAFSLAGVPRLPFRGAMLNNRLDLQPARVEALLRRPGAILFLDDPRAALLLLGKPPVRIEPARLSPLGVCCFSPRECEAALHDKPTGTTRRVAAVHLAIAAPQRFLQLAAELASQPDGELRRATAWCLGMIAERRAELLDDAARAVLLRLLQDKDAAVAAEAAVACGRARLRAAGPAIVALLAHPPQGFSYRAVVEARGRCAFALGLLGWRNPAAETVLMDAFRRRETGRDKTFLGTDGAMAAWALGQLRVEASVGMLRESLFCPAAAESEEEPPPGELVHWDLQAPRFAAPGLAAIGSPAARAALEAALDASGPAPPRPSPELLAQAAEAMARFPGVDRAAILTQMIRHPAPQVRGAAVLACLRQGEPEFRAILRREAAWAVPWWDIQHGAAGPPANTSCRSVGLGPLPFVAGLCEELHDLCRSHYSAKGDRR